MFILIFFPLWKLRYILWKLMLGSNYSFPNITIWSLFKNPSNLQPCSLHQANEGLRPNLGARKSSPGITRGGCVWLSCWWFRKIRLYNQLKWVVLSQHLQGFTHIHPRCCRIFFQSTVWKSTKKTNNEETKQSINIIYGSMAPSNW